MFNCTHEDTVALSSSMPQRKDGNTEQDASTPACPEEQEMLEVEFKNCRKCGIYITKVSSNIRV